MSARPPLGSLIHPTDVNPVAVEVEDAEDEDDESIYDAVEGQSPMTVKDAIFYALRHPEVPVKFYGAHKV